MSMVPDSAPVAAAPSKGTSDPALTHDLTTAGGVARYVASLLDPGLHKCVHRVEQLSGGFTNHVWRVTLAPVPAPMSGRSHRRRRRSTRTGATITVPSSTSSLVLKYFAPQIRALPGVELSQDRAAKEYSALAAMSTALSGSTLRMRAASMSESLLWSVPTPFHFCPTHHAVIMEDAATLSSVLMFDFLRSPHTRSELSPLAKALVDFTRTVPVALAPCHGNGTEWNQGMTELFETSTEPQMLAMVAKCSAFGDQERAHWVDRITAARKHPHARAGQIFGDFWPNSILLHLPTTDTEAASRDGVPTAMSVIDWECSRLGHPDQDFVQMVGNLVTMGAGTRQTTGTFDLGAVETMIAELLAAARPYLDTTWDHAAMSLRYVAYLSQFNHFGITNAARAIAESAEFLENLFCGVSSPSSSSLAAASE